MKTKVISIVVVLITLTTNFFNLSSQTGSEYFFDRKYENNRIVSSTKYELDYDGLHKKTNRVEYTYNEEGKLSKKESYQWDNKKEIWTPKDRIEYTYSFLNDSYTAELLTWDTKTKEFKHIEKVTYQTDINGNIVSLSFMKKDSRGAEIVTFDWGQEIAYLAM